MYRTLVSVLIVCLALTACAGEATPDPTEVARLVDQAVKATVAAIPTPEPHTIEKVVKETVIVEKPIEMTRTIEKEIIVTPSPEPSPTSEFTSNWSPVQVIEAFGAVGLEAEDVYPMTKDDFGWAPMVAAEALRFLIPSLCEDCGGRVFSFTSQADLNSMRDHYVRSSEASALFYSWLFARDNILVQINGDLPEKVARQYEAALNALPMTAGKETELKAAVRMLTPTLAPTAEAVTPADARASRFVSGNASPELPAGEPGEVSLIPRGDFAGQSLVYYVVRNNTTETIRRIDVSAVALAADGSLFAVGGSQGETSPGVIAPGEIALGYAYFSDVELPADVTFEFDMTYKLVRPGQLGDSGDLEIAEFALIENRRNRLVGMLHNPHGRTIYLISVEVYCFDQQNNRLNTYRYYTEKDEIEPGGRIPFQVTLYDECPVFLLTAQGF